jgi:hypothetical protein
MVVFSKLAAPASALLQAGNAIRKSLSIVLG